MEPTPQEKKRGSQISLFVAVAGMLITFLLGIYVGVHPEWIPVKAASFGNDATAPKHAIPATQGDRGMAHTQPTTTLGK